MNILAVYRDDSPALPDKLLTHHEDIVATLAALGVSLQKQPLVQPLRAGSDAAALIEQCAQPLAELERQHDCAHRLPLCVTAGQALEETLVHEQRYAGDSLLWVLGGCLRCALHVDSRVYLLECRRGDLLQLPAGLPHWLALDEHGELAMLRLFANSQAAQATPGDAQIAERFADLGF